ncbi:MAG: type III pantothenate kinase [Oscillospiraceae bacterium]|jgi:type III pantothenate kinase|nr:type III pantothenate kinase [Oscillospiraceae bacterium]
MLLAIDIGNSNIVIGCIDGHSIRHLYRVETDASKTEDEYAAGIKQILGLDGVGTDIFDGAIISSVVPPLTGSMQAAVKKITGRDALVVGAGMKTGLNIRIDDPAQLGSDLVAAAVAVVAHYELPVIIFDMGTATTIGLVDKGANFMGGAIFPGVALSMNALTSGTAQLPKVPIEAPAKCVSTNTIDCMKSGAIFGTASMMDGMIDRIEAELGAKTRIVATGGLSARVVPYCKHEIIHDADLLLRGLAVLYEKNVRS